MKRSLPLYLLFFILFSSIASGMRAHAEFYDNLRSLTSVLVSIETKYVDTVDTDALTETAIRAILKELDPHSTYVTPKEVQQMKEGLNGSFSGIGVSFRMENDTLLVITPTEGGPSQQVGIRPADQIVSCNDTVIAGCKLSNDSIRSILRGPRGTQVKLGIVRQGVDQTLYFNVKRGDIPVPSVPTYYMVNDHVGYIHIERFSATTAEETALAIMRLKEQGMQDLIIDLQGNGGGYLNAAVDLSSMFIPYNETVVYTQGRSDERRTLRAGRTSIHFDGKLAVLIDESTASASEIFSGCIQDYDLGVVIGRRSFGKGLVQTALDLPNQGMVRLTVAHYYTPSGRCIQKPYTKGDQKSYSEDLLNRLNSGELISADSIHLVDSLKYLTRAGRTVYGGGGIVADVFVPLDTTHTTPAHRAVIAKASMPNYLIKYFRKHHQSLHALYPTLDTFADPKTGFILTDDVVTAVIDQARQDSVKHEGLDSLFYNDLFRLQIKAYIANDLYGNGSYKRIINPSSDIYRRALEIMADERKYNSYLIAK